jgi:hypothetical protein
VSTFGRMNSSGHVTPFSGGLAGRAFRVTSVSILKATELRVSQFLSPRSQTATDDPDVGDWVLNRIASSRSLDRMGYFEAVRRTTAASDVEY